MPRAKMGDAVRVHYTGVTNGQQFDSSYDRGEPLEFTLGARQVVAGFESAVIGMSPNETKTVDIPASQAYGPYNPDMALQEDLSELPPGLEVGSTLVGRDASGRQMRFTVVEIGDGSAVLDANHPLAGRDLTFSIELVEISEPAETGDVILPWGEEEG